MLSYPTHKVATSDAGHEGTWKVLTANLHAKMIGFAGIDSSMILISRGGIPRPVGNSPESLSQAILVGIILVGRLGAFPPLCPTPSSLHYFARRILTVTDSCAHRANADSDKRKLTLGARVGAARRPVPRLGPSLDNKTIKQLITTNMFRRIYVNMYVYIYIYIYMHT